MVSRVWMGTVNRTTSIVVLVLVATLVIPSQYSVSPLSIKSSLSQFSGSSPLEYALSQIHELSSMTQIAPLIFSIPNAYALTQYELQTNDANHDCETLGGQFSAGTCLFTTSSPILFIQPTWSLTIDPGVTLQMAGDNIENSGSIVNSGTINANGVFSNGPAATISGSGTINTSLATFSAAGAGAITDPITIVTSDVITTTSTLNFPIILTPGTTLTINSGVFYTIFQGETITIDGGAALVNSGTLVISTQNFNPAIINISPGGNIVNSGFIALHGEINNSGAINNNNGATFAIDFGSPVGGALNNGGQFSNSGNFELQSTTPMPNTGIITNLSGGFFLIQGGSSIINSNGITDGGTIENTGTLQNNGGATITFNSGGILQNGAGTLANGGTVTIDGGATINDYDAGIIVNGGGTITDSGIINIEGFDSVHNYPPGILHNDAGTLTLLSGGVITNSGAFTSSGAISNNSGGAISGNCGSSFSKTGTLTGNNPVPQCPTTSSISPNPGTVKAGQTILLTATITDGSSTPTNPQGNVVFSDGTPSAGGTFTSPSCTPQGNNALACSSTYTAPSSGSSITIASSYTGTDFVHQTSSGTDQITVTTSTALKLTPASGPAGSSATASATGFQPGETVQISFAGTSVGSCVSDPSDTTGSCSTTFQVPSSPTLGANAVTATGASSGSTASAQFTVTTSTALQLTPASGPAGSSATASATGFHPGEEVSISFAGTSVGSCVSDPSDSTGSCSTTFQVPSSPTLGANAVTATGTSGDTSSATFTVIATPTLKLSPSSGQAGSLIRASASGFGAGELVSISYAGISVGICTTDSTGFCSSNITVPPTTTTGANTVTATGTTTGSTASAIFTARAASTLTLTPSSGQAGSSVQASATGFQPGEIVQISYAGISVGTCLADSTGSCSSNILVPSTTVVGANTVTALGQTLDDVASATFTATIASTLTLTPNIGQAGSSVQASATGFQPSETVQISYAGISVGTCLANNTGSCSTTFQVPSTTVVGVNAVTATGASSSLTATATFAALAPTLTLNTSSGQAGSLIRASATGFGANELVSISYDNTLVGTCTTDISGFCFSNITVPPTTPLGANTVTATGATTGTTATATFTARAASTLTLTPSSGQAGSSATASVTGFQPGETVQISYAGTNVGTCLADSTGSCSSPILVPSTTTLGVNTVTAIGQTLDDVASATFTATASPTITLTLGSGNPGTQLTVNGNGFDPNAQVEIDLIESSSQVLSDVTTDGSGSLSSTIVIPAISTAPFSATISAHETSNPSVTANAPFSVTVPALPPVPPTINAPSTVTSGKSYAASVQARSGMTYSWTITDGTITSPGGTAGVTAGGTNSITFTAGSLGTLSLSTTEINAVSTSATGTQSISVVPPPVTPTITAQNPVITGQSYSASVQARSGMTYSWTITDGTITSPGGTAGVTAGGTNSITFTAGSLGTLSLSTTEINAAGDGSTPGTASLTVVMPLQVSISPSPSSPVVGNTVSLSANINDPGCPSCTSPTSYSFAWSIISKPAGSTAALSSTSTSSPTFTTDLPGNNYQVSLIVTDSLGHNSTPAFETIQVSDCGKCAPVVSPTASPNPAPVENTVTLDANPTDTGCPACLSAPGFTYAWSITSAPSGSKASLSSVTVQNPTFVPDVLGSYQFSVTATDQGGLASTPVSVTLTAATPLSKVTISNTSPNVGNPVQLSANAECGSSACGISETLSYQWSFTTVPPGSGAAISNPSSATPSFVPDVAGQYDIRLVVTDILGNSATATDNITVLQPLSVSATASPTSAIIGTTFNLNAIATGGATPYSFSWTQVSGPLVTPSSLTGQTISVVPKIAGTYKFSVVATDSLPQTSAPFTVTLTAQSQAQATQNLITFINNLHLDNGITNSLDAKLGAALSSLNSGDGKTAKNQLNAFINEVNAQTGKKITQAQAGLLIPAVQNIINSIH